MLDLGNLVLDAWKTWLTGLSEDVNGRGGMYPHSTVKVWAGGLDDLASGTIEKDLAQRSAAPWRIPTLAPSNTHDPCHPLVTSFQSALLPLRHRFHTELGWLTGRGAAAPSGPQV